MRSYANGRQMAALTERSKVISALLTGGTVSDHIVVIQTTKSQLR